MGMYTLMSGEIEIEPPLNHQELKKVDKANFSEIKVYVKVEETETDEGTLIKRQGTSVGPAHPYEQFKNYNVREQLQRLVKMFPGHQFSGSILCVFEEIEGVKTMVPLGGTECVPYIEGIWAYEIRNGNVVALHPVISQWSEKEPNK